MLQIMVKKPNNEERWKFIFHIFLKIRSEVVAPLKGEEDSEWEAEAAAGSKFSNVTPWPGRGCFGPGAQWSFKTVWKEKFRSDHFSLWEAVKGLPVPVAAWILPWCCYSG